MTEHADALGLEQRCVRPGHWLIEGRVVYRFAGRWQIYAVGDYPHGPNAPEQYTKTLAQARDWIRDHR